MHSSTSPWGATSAARRSTVVHSPRIPRASELDTSSKARVRSSTASLQMHGCADHAYGLAARIAEQWLHELLEPRYFIIREQIQSSKHVNQGRVRRSLRTVLDFDRDAELSTRRTHQEH